MLNTWNMFQRCIDELPRKNINFEGCNRRLKMNLNLFCGIGLFRGGGGGNLL